MHFALLLALLARDGDIPPEDTAKAIQTKPAPPPPPPRRASPQGAPKIRWFPEDHFRVKKDYVDA